VSARPSIACLGAGRMARGIAVVFAYAGHGVRILDVKAREETAYAETAAAVIAEVRRTLASLADFGLFAAAAVDDIAGLVSVAQEGQAAVTMAEAAVVFEAVPEVLELKRQVLARVSALAPRTIIASTTSTILVDQLADAVAHPERFLNAHWLNPAFLVPLVELAPGTRTDPEVTQYLRQLLHDIGKVPVVCAARPGYIVPRIQALAMNEAARLLEEGVASAEDIDKAIKYGFGVRFATLGMLEFIDWGGGDILYYASRSLSEALGSERYAAPAIVERNMREDRVGLRTGQGFMNYEALDIEAYRRQRLRAFVELLGHLGLMRPPVLPG